MRKLGLLGLIATLFYANSYAYDCEVGGIYYNLNSNDFTAKVTRNNNQSNGYSGSIVIPSSITYNNVSYSVTSIENSAFYYCSELTSVTIPNGVISIGNYAFLGCTGLTSITIPNSITSVGYAAFGNCIGLKSVVWNAKQCQDFYTSPFASAKDSITSFIFGDSVEVIPQNICCDISALTSIIIPNGVKSIRWYAFKNCSALTSVIISNSVISIGQNAFENCSSLTTVFIPNSVRTIEAGAFSGCMGLTSINIPDSITSIEAGVFSNCSSLDSIIIPNGITSIGGNAFKNCSRLTSITIPNGVKYIDAYAFSGCSGLTSISIPSSVISIGYNAFYRCKGLTSIEFSDNRNTSYRYNNLLDSCVNLTSVICHSLYPPIAEQNSFSFVANRGATLYVPKNSSIPLYLSATGWREFANVESYSTFTITANANDFALGVVTGGGTYESGENATLAAVARSGYQFINWNDGNTDNPRIVVVTQDSTFTAIFAVEEFNITVKANDSTWGTVTGSGRYERGDTATLEAIANSGYKFINWSDGITQNPRTVVVTQDSTFTAVFAVEEFTITVGVNDSTWGVVVGGGMYENGQSATLAAVPATDYKFVRWSDGNIQNPRVVVVTQDSTFIAEFAPIQSSLTETGSTEVTAWAKGEEVYVRAGERGGVVSLYSVQGKLIETIQAAPHQELRFAVRQKGVYFVVTRTENSTKTVKVVVK